MINPYKQDPAITAAIVKCAQETGHPYSVDEESGFVFVDYKPESWDALFLKKPTEDERNISKKTIERLLDITKLYDIKFVTAKQHNHEEHD